MTESDFKRSKRPGRRRDKRPKDLKEQLTPEDIRTLQQGILDLLAEEPMKLEELADRLGFDSADVEAVLSQLHDEGKIFLNVDQEWQLAEAKKMKEQVHLPEPQVPARPVVVVGPITVEQRLDAVEAAITELERKMANVLGLLGVHERRRR